jgi:hypothetical protein
MQSFQYFYASLSVTAKACDELLLSFRTYFFINLKCFSCFIICLVSIHPFLAKKGNKRISGLRDLHLIYEFYSKFDFELALAIRLQNLFMMQSIH